METKAKLSPVIYITAIIVTLLAIASVTLSAMSLINSHNILAQVTEDSGSEETQENDVDIMGYKIRATTQISDAYISGDTSELNEKDIETLDMASSVLDEIITDDMTDFDKEKAVYDWMTHNLQGNTSLLTVIPSTTADCDNPYGVLKYHNAVCVGYATTFRLFMQMMEIPCMVVHNTELYHSWDLVQLDGEWYHTDVYSDAGRGGYVYFNLSDAMLSNIGDRTWDTDFFPDANGLKYNMSYITALEDVDMYDIPSFIRTAIDEKSGIVSVKFGADLTENDAQIIDQMIDDVQETMWNISDYDGVYLGTASFVPIDGGYLFTVSVEDYRDIEVSELTDEENEKISEAIDKAFGDISGTGDGDYEGDVYGW